MDPNATLEELRKLATKINDGECESDTDHFVSSNRLAELAIALDGWLSNQGFLPKAWERKEATGGMGAGKGPS